MRIEARFCISHGDEMKLYGMTSHTNAFGTDTEEGRAVSAKYALMTMDWHIENMAGHLITGVLYEQQEGRMGERAHLVTHPEDR